MSTFESFAAAIANPDLPPPRGLSSVAGANDPLRFAVYRNNVHVSLVSALLKGFPVVAALVGEPFFKAMARAYVAENRPRSPVLLHYGDGFAAFIASFPPAQKLAYLPDVARLEYAWRQAYHAADRPPLTLAHLSGIPSETLPEQSFAPHPAAALIASSSPIGAIWSAHQQTPPAPLDTGAAQSVLVTRPHHEVRLTVLPPHDYAFARALLDGASIGDAAARNEAPEFDPGTALVGLIGAGAFASPETAQ
ncbi:DUF2063 domain-containing protein [Devosia pacifica]|uniref:DUF2063 domain-containing protein n=1 Tax=Devosia pacifica TaxID=1335967 RepID=A0A918VRQ7_9HYPH|nr:putative DNA-binding domain-containing protein [Devosia pacifica]GHA16909.1 DUF2063 domain-containing protein [Devosia pacifica]